MRERLFRRRLWGSQTLPVLAIAGTRPEIIKLVPVVRALRDACLTEVRFCHSGQHPDLGRELLDIAGISPDEALIRPAGADLGHLVAGMTSTIGAAIDRQKPNAVIVQGDTATTMAATFAAFHRQVPIAHVEAGLRSGSMAAPWPEEGYRRMISQIAHWHFAPTDKAGSALRGENIVGSRVQVVGYTVVDAMFWALNRLGADPLLGSAAQPLIEAAQGRPIVLATVHRRETGADAMRRIAAGLSALAHSDNVHIVLPVHPRAQSGVLADMLGHCPRISLTPALGYFAFLRLLRASRLVISDSGGIQEEATAMGRPVLVLRETTERGEAVEIGTARMVGHDDGALITAARWALARDLPQPSTIFGDGRAAERIARTLLDDLVQH